MNNFRELGEGCFIEAALCKISTGSDARCRVRNCYARLVFFFFLNPCSGTIIFDLFSGVWLSADTSDIKYHRQYDEGKALVYMES